MTLFSLIVSLYFFGKIGASLMLTRTFDSQFMLKKRVGIIVGCLYMSDGTVEYLGKTVFYNDSQATLFSKNKS